MIFTKKNQRGFIALFSVIIISFVLVLVATTLSFSGFFTRFNIVDSESKKRSESLADACIEQARLELAQGIAPIGVITIGSDSCDYSVITSGIFSEIISHSVILGAHTYYWVKVKTDESNIPIIEFKECPDLSTCP